MGFKTQWLKSFELLLEFEAEGFCKIRSCQTNVNSFLENVRSLDGRTKCFCMSGQIAVCLEMR